MTKKSPVEIPGLQEFLKSGVQFGHEVKRWNPKMKDYIFGSKNNIHIIDLTKTVDRLEDALVFLNNASRLGPVLFVGTKRQASDIIREEAIRAGGYFISHRWAGGLLTNFQMISKSLKKLQKIEEDFEQGIEGKTKYEVSRIKVEWSKLNRLYQGVKGMTRIPTALVVVDPRYEVGAVMEARKMGIPVVAITDTNCNPDLVDYIVPANDDALASIRLLTGLFADAIIKGNGGQGVRHHIKDYSKEEIKIVKKVVSEEQSESVGKSKIRIKSIAAEEVVYEDKAEDSKPEQPKSAPKPKTEKPKKEAPAKVAKESEKAKETKAKVQLSARVEKALKDAKLTLAKAKKLSDEEIKEVKGLGEKAIEEIRNA